MKILNKFLKLEPKNRDQLITVLRNASHKNLIAGDALSMIEGVLQISELQVRDIMTPRSQMVVIKFDQEFDDLLKTVIQSGHSRFLVIGDTEDNVIGLLHAKDLLNYAQIQAQTSFELQDILRPASIVPESKRLNLLLKEFRANRNHMAIVVDEYGNVSGFVTIEDIIEQIVGDIEDEFDINEEALIKQHSETEYIIKAHTPIDDFNEYFQEKFDQEEFDSIGGLVIHAFGHLPRRGETITIKNRYQFKVLHGDNRRVRLLHLTLGEK